MFNKEGLGGKGGDGQNVNLSGAQTYFSTPARRLLWPWIWWWGAECKRERGHGGFAGDNTFLFSESESDLSRYCQVYFCLLSVLDKACVGESTRADICVFKFRNISWEETTKMKLNVRLFQPCLLSNYFFSRILQTAWVAFSWDDTQSQNKHVADKQSSRFTASSEIFNWPRAPPHPRPAATADLSVLSSRWKPVSRPSTSLCLTPITIYSHFTSPNLSRFYYSHSIYVGCCCLYSFSQALNCIATQCSDNFIEIWTVYISVKAASYCHQSLLSTHVDHLIHQRQYVQVVCSHKKNPNKTDFY